jgi:hypothetical protein
MLAYPAFNQRKLLCIDSDDYLILITSRKRITRVLETDVYLATDFKVLPIRSSSSNLSDKLSTHQADETFLLSLVKGHLYSGPFYYTYGGLDLTSRLQKQDRTDSRPMWQRVSLLAMFVLDLPGQQPLT